MKEKEFLPRLGERLGITTLNPMQRRMLEASSENKDIILLSPTGSGKTVAFILPVLKRLKPSTGRVQAVVVAPSRELVMQIARVFNEVAADFKVTPLYGGHKVEDEVNALRMVPDIVVATPGRLLDHSNRRNIDLLPTRILVLDEFDKILELGFEKELKKILDRLKNVSRTILTSATRADVFPEFLRLDNPIEVNFLEENRTLRRRMRVNRVTSDGKDKLVTLLNLLHTLAAGKTPEKSIIFLNHRESAERTARFLESKGADCVLYHGALDQHERESAIAAFNNGSRPVLVATDLAARGLDISGVRNVIHYHQPLSAEAYTHRNGRTARVEEDGEIFVLIGPEEDVKEYVEFDRELHVDIADGTPLRSGLDTLFISAGRKEKLSKGDILGFLTKECGIAGSLVGGIDVFDHYSLVALPAGDALLAVEKGKSSKIKGTRRKVSIL